MTGIELISAERKRQVEVEGWTARHDSGHVNDELALAAACYALPKHVRNRNIMDRPLLSYLWPFSFDWWKPKQRNRIKELVKAGALIAAEIDRLQEYDNVPC